MIHFLYHYFLTKSYDHGDLSHVYPITRSAPALVLLFSIIFLKEKLSLFGVIGIIFLVIGVYIINLKKLSKLLDPFTSVFSEKQTQYAFLTLLCVAIYSVLDKVGITYYHPIILLYSLILIQAILFGIYITKKKKKKEIIKEWRLNKLAIIICSVIGPIGYYLILLAFDLSKISYVVGLRQLSVIFAVIMAGFI